MVDGVDVELSMDGFVALASLGLSPDDGLDPHTPAGLGSLSAQAVIDARLADGSNAANGFAQVTSSVYPELYEPANSADPSAPNARGGSVGTKRAQMGRLEAS